MRAATRSSGNRFRVEPWLDLTGRLTARWTGLWRYLGNLETRRLSDALDGIELRAPIFVCGLARGGTTILLECLAAHRDTATHVYRDYPGVLAPVIWSRIAARLYDAAAAPVERTHGDGIFVTPDSPEAVEEMLWMAFHPHIHDPACDNRILRGGVRSDFAAFYRDHMRKLLWQRGGRRYLSKGNYNLARLGALIELFPDARFIVPVRDPVAHIASLMNQHALFCAGERRYPAALRYMQRIGHFEFGLDRRPLNLGNAEVTSEVRRLWRDGRAVEGWSLYWADVHGYLADQLDTDLALRHATLLVPFEALCADPSTVLGRVFAHAGLSMTDRQLAALADRIQPPSRRALPFDEADVRTIRAITAGTAARL